MGTDLRELYIAPKEERQKRARETSKQAIKANANLRRKLGEKR